jgi:glycosyltransferase involved in cell wall biosynthesis
MHSYEARTAAAFDRVIITSEQDKKSLEELITQSDHLDTPISVIRNGVDSDYFKPIDGLPEDIELVFSGKMSYSPNVSAILGFYRDVFPIVRAALPGARLKIVGSSPTEPVLRLANDPNVTVTGYVPDIRPHLASAKVVICPLTIGVGIQNKVLEAMAMGKAVMSTALSFQGIPEAVDGRHMLIADDPEDMANGILKLIDDRARARVLGKNALSLVRESYSWEASTRQLESLYGGAIESAKYRAHAAP